MKNKTGFTLIELLVVFAIIGILFATVAANFNTSKSRARDALRESDIKQYQTQLEVFANTQSSQLYPSRITTAVDITSLCTTLGISATCPTDPQAPTYIYSYISNGTGFPNNNASQYILWAHLEATSNYFVICSNGKTGTSATAPTILPCPI